MYSRTAFDLDCTPIIPECGFNCPKCIREIESTLVGMEGVSRVYRGSEEDEGKLFVEHDPGVVKVERLVEILKGLPSFYDGFFVPTVITS